MKFAKVRHVKSPDRGTSLSAGIDFFVPEFDMDFLNDLKEKNPHTEYFELPIDENTMIAKKIILKPQGRILIPSGIHVNLEDLETNGIALIAHNKSGVGTKLGLDRLAEVVDEDYQGEIHISVVNTSRTSVEITPNQKLVQFLLIPVLYNMPEEVNYSELYSTKSGRGDKGFGQGTGL